MAYVSTIDERYGGSFLSSNAGTRDAPVGVNANYVLAQGIASKGYGASLLYGYLADVDTYSLGILAPGKYTVRASGNNWDFTNSIFGFTTPTVDVLTSTGSVLGTSFWGAYSFNVYSSSTFYISITGTSYSSSEYDFYYTYDGALPSAINTVATGDVYVAGNLQVGSTINALGTYSDANGIVGVVPAYQWYYQDTVSLAWVPINGATSASYQLTSNETGKYVGFIASFVDNAGYYESLPAIGLTAVVVQDTAAPTASTFSPADEATAVAIGANVVVTFSENIQRGSGNIVLKKVDGTTVATYAQTSAAVTVSGSTLTINPSVDLSYSTGYKVEFAVGSVQDLSGNNYAGTTNYNFTTGAAPDTTAPTITTFSPADGATGVGVASNITLTFNEPVVARSGGTIELMTDYGFGHQSVEMFSVSDATRVTISGNVLTIDPTSAMLPSTGYHLGFNNALADNAGNAFSYTHGQYNFTTGVAPDTTEPTASTFSPADEATAVAIGANVVVTFSEAIQRGAGNIVLKKANGTTVTTYAQTSTEVTVSGSTLTINPAVDLSYSTGYKVEFAVGSVQDMNGNNFLGTTTYNFMSEAQPVKLGSGSITSGIISQNTIWEGDITLSGSVKINPGVTLTILPGAHITAQADKSIMIWADTGARLYALGNSQNKITFESSGSNPDQWLGLRLNNNTVDTQDVREKSSLSHVIIKEASVGIHVSSQGLSVNNSDFSLNSKGIWLGKDVNGVEITSSKFANSGILTSYESETVGPYNNTNSWGGLNNITINSNEFTNTGISILPNQRNIINVEIGNNKITTNATGIQMGGGGYGSHIGNLNIHDNEITAQTGLSLRAYSWLTGGVEIKNNNFTPGTTQANTGIFLDYTQSKPNSFNVEGNFFLNETYGIRGLDYSSSAATMDIKGNLFLNNKINIDVPKAKLNINSNIFANTTELIYDKVVPTSSFENNNIYNFGGSSGFVKTREASSSVGSNFNGNYFDPKSKLQIDYADDGSENFLYPIIKFTNNATEANITATNYWPVWPNNIPTANNISFTASEDFSISGKLTAVDKDNDILSYLIFTNPKNGVVNLGADGIFKYTPNLNFNGVDSFTYKANDGTVASVEAKVSIILNAINDAPTGRVTITGSSIQGQMLTATNTLSDSDLIPSTGAGSITYQWQVDGNNISGATGNTLILTQAQVSKNISVKASYIDQQGTPESVTNIPFYGKYEMVAGQNHVRPNEVVNQKYAGGSTNPSNSNGNYATATLINGSVTSSGSKDYGGDTSVVSQFLTKDIKWLAVIAEGGFVAIKDDGSLQSWGNWSAGSKTAVGIESIAVSMSGWAALQKDGQIVTGGAYQGGVPKTGEFVKVFAGGYGGYAALKKDGELVKWGYGADAVASGSLSQGVVDVLFSYGGALAIKQDGTDVTWGGASDVKAWLKTQYAITAVANINDVPTGNVTIGGTTTQGQVLTASNSLADIDLIPFTGAGAITYQWLADSINISGASGTTFTLANAQVGKSISVKASYTDQQGTLESVTSAASAAVANVNDAPTGSVTIGGTTTQGQLLTASNNLADIDLIPSTGAGAITYQWLADGTNISGASGTTFTLSQAQVGKAISVKANYTDQQGTAESVTSAATTAVANINDAPAGSVTTTGTLTQGQLLTASNSLTDIDVIPSSGTGAVAYQWLADGANISGATSNSLTLTQSQVGKAISVKASYTDQQGTLESVTSSLTAAVANVNDAPAGSVTITGTSTQGQVLTASNSLTDIDLIPSTGAGAITYQWLADGANISGATTSSYTLTNAQVGKAISVKASYTDQQGTLESVTSTATAAVLALNAGVSWSNASNLSTNESGTTATYGAVLDRAPSKDVKLTLTINDATEGVFALTGTTALDLVFTPSNWFQVQEVLVKGVDDGDYDRDVAYTISTKVSSLDLNYDGLRNAQGLATSNVAVLNVDDDIPITRIGTDANDVFVGGPGADDLYGDYGRDDLSGGKGADRIYGGYGDDVLAGDEGNDEIEGDQGDDRLSGGAGNDNLKGGTGADTLAGGDGDDVLNGGEDADAMDGGNGADTYYIDNPGDVVTDSGNDNAIDVLFIASYLSAPVILGQGIENATLNDSASNGAITGNESNNTLKGNASDNALVGGAGNDTLESGSGNDSVNGGVGDDLIVGGNGAGNDTYVGGSGADTVRYTSAVNTILVSLLEGVANGQDIGTDKLSEIENLIGGQAGDTLTGDAAANFINGHTGNDTITGNAGNDTLDGGEGQDTAVYALASSQYTVTSLATGGYQIAAKAGAQSTEGTDTLLNIESLKFADQSAGVASFVGQQSAPAVAKFWKDNTKTITESKKTEAVNLTDAIAILKMIVGLNVNSNNVPLSPYQAIAADFDKNGAVELTDAIGVLKMVVGLNAPSPAWTYYDDAKLATAYNPAQSLNPKAWTTTAAVADAAQALSSVKLVGVLAGDVDGSWAG